MATCRAICVAKNHVTCFVVMVSQAIIFAQQLCESEFKTIPYMAHQLISVCTNNKLDMRDQIQVMALVFKYFVTIRSDNFKHNRSVPIRIHN